MRALLEQLKLDEGLSLGLYKCTELKNTIGYGRNLDANGISQEEAEFMLYNDTLKVTNILTKKIPEILDEINLVRRDVLFNMAYNLGVNGLLNFKKMIKAVKAGDFEEAAIQMLDSVWAKQVGKRATRLAEEMRAGIQQGKWK